MTECERQLFLVGDIVRPRTEHKKDYSLPCGAVSRVEKFGAQGQVLRVGESTQWFLSGYFEHA